MKKQIIVISTGLVLVLGLFFFGRTTSNKKSTAAATTDSTKISSFNIFNFIEAEKQKLTAQNVVLLASMEEKLVAATDVPTKIAANLNLSTFWKDSLKVFEPFAFYNASAAKLDNSEKNLTFAARIFLENLRGEKDDIKLDWETNEAIDLFERAIKVNPENDDLRIGLGSCYIYGKGRDGNPQETMKGVQELLAVARKDSGNMKAQMMLGVGGLVSGQFDKAVERLKKVVAIQPNNPEAVAYLADAYAGVGNKPEAIRYYNISKRLINNPHYNEEVDERIKNLK